MIKMSCMANCTSDSLRMLHFVQGKENLAGMCMGDYGHITRILGPVVGSTMTFAKIEGEASPGQLSAEELTEVYNFGAHSENTKIYGLIGNPVTQSPSHVMHNAFFKRERLDAVYVKMRLEESEIPRFFSLAKSLQIRGLSVTIPFKEKLFNEIDEIEGDVKEIGAVNTITFADGRVYGGNTDAAGALDALEETGLVRDRRMVILGKGGSAKAIAFEAKKRGARVTMLGRNPIEIGDYDILINTTPNPSPIDLAEILPRTVMMDITVTQAASPMMIRAKALGCRMVYGMDMFKKQASGQFARWLQLTVR